MANEVRLRHGSPLMVDYTPGSAVLAGAVVLIGNRPHICHTDIAASRKGAMAMEGGIYAATADAAITLGTDVYWDATNLAVSASPLGAYLGICVVASAGASEIQFLHAAKQANTAPIAAANVDGDTPITILDEQSGTTFHTAAAGVSGAIQYDLPAAVPGLEYHFRVGSAQELQVDPNGTESLALADGVQITGGVYMTANAVGEACTVKCVVTGTWEHQNSIGTWTAGS